MSRASFAVVAFVILLDFSISTLAQDQDYLFTSPGQNQYYPQNPTSFINPSAGIPFQPNPTGFQTFPPFGGFYSRDLETSDLPRDLQQTLPQYRQGLNPTGFGNRIPNSPVGFRPTNYVQPSTHRPNYSHLFSQAHLRNPAQPETFLGEVQLDDPLETPPQYTKGFKPLKTEDGNTFGRNGIRNDIFKTRTRFLAPERGGKKLTQVKNYVVGNNGEVFSETSSSSPNERNAYGSTKQAISFNSRPEKQLYVPKSAKSSEQKNSLDLESLLEEPIDNNNEHSNKDNVEVVKSTKKELNESEYDEETEEPPEYEEYEDEEEESEVRPKDVTNQDEENNDFERDEYEKDTRNEDSNDRRNRLEIPVTEDTSYEAATVQTTSKASLKLEQNITPVNAVTQIPMIVSMATSVNVKKQHFDDNLAQENKKKEPDVVVSVVTSKTVVNNTVLGLVTQKPLVTEPVRTTEIINPDNSTDSWVVVASVQTSRSISGARYLPKGIIQDERHKLLNEHDELEPTSTPENDANYEATTQMDITMQISSELPLTEVESSTKARTSTESLLEKLERVESDVASGLLTGGFKTDNIAVINAAHGMHDKELTTPDSTPLSSTPSTTKDPYPQVKIRKYSPVQRLSTTSRPGSKERFKKLQKSSITSTTANVDLDRPQGDQPSIVLKEDISALLPPGYKPEKEEKPDKSSLLSEILSKAKIQESIVQTQPNKVNISQLLPPDYKSSGTPEPPIKESKTESSLKTTLDDVSKFLPPGYKEPKSTTKKPATVLDDISKFLPPGYKSPKTTSKPPVTVLEDVSKFLPPDFKASKNQKEIKTESPLKVTKDDIDVTKLLPPGFKLPRTTNKPPPTVLDDVGKFLPPGYKQRKYEKGGYKTTGAPRTTTEQTKEVNEDLKKAQPVDISSLLPPGFNATSKLKNSTSNDVLANLLPPGFNLDNENKTEKATTQATTAKSAANEKKQIKLVFPGQKSRKTPRLTTPRSSDEVEIKPSVPTIHKGWPSRATTEFTGWPTPSTTPISIEKLLEAARTATASSSTADTLTDVTSTTTTTTTTTTTPRPTTPGICKEQCDLVGTIKIVDNEKWKWRPEYLDRNTQEYQDLANTVEDQLNEVYQSSPILKKWYKNIRVDGFSEGSILVDYLVELNEVGRQISTQDIKRLFHEALTNQDDLSNSGLKENASREGKALNETITKDGKLTLGQFVVDPKYTDFIVIPKSNYPTVGYAEDNVLLPQWAIAVIVIGLASLLFVIIFGVTVLANRQKNSKKKTTPLTEDMLNELNKNHMGGYDNYGADDLYNMEEVWNERAYDQKPKKRSNGSINENSTANLYDSWRSDWNGYYYNNYYGNPGSQHSGYSGRRRSDYDTNF